MIYFNEIKSNLSNIVPFFNKIRRLSISEKSDIAVKTVFAATAAGVITSRFLSECYVLTIILITKIAVTYCLAKRHFGALDKRDHYDLFKTQSEALYAMIKKRPDLSDDQVFNERQCFKEEFAEEISDCQKHLERLKDDFKKYNAYIKVLKGQKRKIENFLKKLDEVPENRRKDENVDERIQQCKEKLTEIESELQTAPQKSKLYKNEILKYKDLIPK
jgi:uncharacterized phage infection (PIP) family protein YhgE